MRYFLSLAFTETALSRRVGQPAASCGPVFMAGSAQRLRPCRVRTPAGAIHVATITVTADPNLTMATGTVIKAGTSSVHRLRQPMKAGAGFKPEKVGNSRYRAKARSLA